MVLLRHPCAGEHSLTQSDLPEIRSQGVVSEVLRGKRELNISADSCLGDAISGAASSVHLKVLPWVSTSLRGAVPHQRHPQRARDSVPNTSVQLIAYSLR